MNGVIIQARMGSTRLPGKVLKKINGKYPMLYYLIRQIKECKLLEKFVIATTTLKEDDSIVQFLNQQNVEHFRGNEKDVLERYYNCAKKFSFDPIIRITADNPLIDPKIVDLAIKTFQSNSVDYVTNCIPRTFPYGTEVEVFSFNALETTWKNARKSSEREHVTPYIYNNPEKFKILNFSSSINLSNFRWTVDRQNDFQLIENIILEVNKKPILMEDILKLFKEKPELCSINKKNLPNEEYLKTIRKDESVMRNKEE